MFKLDICRPDQLFAAVWCCAVGGYALAFSMPSVLVLLWVTAFGALLWCGAVLSYLVPLPTPQASRLGKAGLGYGVTLLSIISLWYAAMVVMYISGSGIGLLALAEIRQAALAGEPVIANANTLVTAVQMNFCIALLGYIEARPALMPARGQAVPTAATRWRVRLFFWCALVSLFISLLDGSRAFFLMGAICLVIAQLIIGIYRIRRAMLFALAFIIVFSITFPFVRPEVDDAFDGFRYTMVYFAGGVGSLDKALDGSVRVYWQDFEAIANKLGAIIPGMAFYDLGSLRMDMVNLTDGLQTNVFTSLGVYHEYLGWITFPFAVLAGALLTLSGRMARSATGYLFIYAFYAAATILSLFHEYYLSTSYLLLKVAVVVTLLRLATACWAGAASVGRLALRGPSVLTT